MTMMMILILDPKGGPNNPPPPHAPNTSKEGKTQLGKPAFVTEAVIVCIDE